MTIMHRPRIEITAADIAGAKSANAVHIAIYAMATAFGRALAEVIETDSEGRPSFAPIAPADGVQWFVDIALRGGSDCRFKLAPETAEWLDQGLASAHRDPVRKSDWNPMQPFAFELPEAQDVTDCVTILAEGLLPWRTDTH